jgi:hypothetical protein
MAMKPNPTDGALRSQQEAFAQAVASGSNQSDAYRKAYPKSLKWKPEAVHVKASELAANEKVAVRIKSLRDALAERSTWTREQSVKVLAAIANGAEKDADRVRAVAELNVMHGFREPEEFEHSGAITTIVRQIIEPVRRLDATEPAKFNPPARQG